MEGLAATLAPSTIGNNAYYIVLVAVIIIAIIYLRFFGFPIVKAEK